MPEAEDQAGFRTCTLPERPWKVEYSTAALEEILKSSLDGLLAFPSGGLEVGGVLYGAVEGDLVRIVASRPVACEHIFGPGYTLSENDENELRAALDSSSDPALAGLVAVGWYHSHTRTGLVLSATDMELHRRCFHEPWHLAMLVQPSFSKPTRIGFYLRGPDGALREAPDFEFQVSPEIPERRPARREEREPTPGLDSVEPPAAAGETSAAETPVPEIPPTEPPPEWRERRRGWIWAGVPVGLVLLSAGLFLPGPWRKTSMPAPLALRLVQRDGRLEIRWDPAAPAVRQARRGWLEITDGLAEVVFPLDAKLLQAGFWSMVRQSPEVRVRLRVQGPEVELIEQSAQFQGPLPRTFASQQPLEPPAPKQVTPAELAKLRAELESQSAERNRLEQRLKELANEPPPAAPAAPLKPKPRKAFQMPQILARRGEREAPSPPEIAQAPSLPTRFPVQAGPLAEPPAAPPPPEAVKPAPAEVAKPVPARREPKSGRLIWTGYLPRNSVLTIDRGRPSNGHLTGALPSSPCRVGASPAEFVGGGLAVYSVNPRFARQPLSEPPGPQNGWNRTTFRYEPRVAGDLVVIEAPGPHNGWSRIVLRSGERPVSLVLLEWEIIPSGADLPR